MNTKKSLGLKQFMKAGALIAVAALAGEQIGCAHLEIPLGCTASAWKPEVFSFYGSPETIKQKMSRADMKLGLRNAFMYMVEGPTSATIRLYRRRPSSQWKAWQWSGTPEEARLIREEEAKQILAQQGQQCVGQVAEEIATNQNFLSINEADVPKTAREAFEPLLSEYDEDAYVGGSIFLLC